MSAPDTFASFMGSTCRVRTSFVSQPLLPSHGSGADLSSGDVVRAWSVVLLVTELNMLVHCVSCPSRWAYDSN